ncbi:glycerol-3-phosphate 1-O-acyltransferase PlsY [Prosthecomicrobium sp. N25]|uniref:glycerol-3-phosphate 1-O-acyltransferase PlsY n=1 Tax=Prosthecomicrobium sp. N25 TaxID=3129254 RepID=UPI003077777E
MIPILVALAFGYLMGSVPYGLVLTRAAGLGDIRAIGSGNIGATNVLRTGNKKLAAATLLADALKGTAAVLIAGAWSRDAAIAAGLGAFLGHLFPVWLGFKGGKGVATYIGILLGLHWPAVLVFAAVWLLCAWTTRYSSLSALTAAVVVPLATWLLPGVAAEPRLALVLAAMTVLVFVRHKANIERLLAGTESRIGKKG